MALTQEQKQARAESRRLNAALKEEARAHAHEAMRLKWRNDDMYLSREQAAAGEACRGCGLPVIDNLGRWAPLMQLTEDERREREEANAQFSGRHRGCDAYSWTMEGSRATHGGLCCPPIPFSERQLESISQILRGHTVREEELDVWTLTLTCGHHIERTVHHTNRYWTGSTTHCPECDITRGIVTSERTVEAADRLADAKRKRESDLRRVETELAKAEAAASEARRKLAALQMNDGDAL